MFRLCSLKNESYKHRKSLMKCRKVVRAMERTLSQKNAMHTLTTYSLKSIILLSSILCPSSFHIQIFRLKFGVPFLLTFSTLFIFTDSSLNYKRNSYVVPFQFAQTK